ncbi:MAG: hypothetical protein H0Z33_12080 [Bacillaceae bacterium]|nr:hypothetical protein [Bacillaceae bacterium]
MKITSMNLRIEEEDFDLYESILGKLGWEHVSNHVYRKKFGDTEVELREHLPAFSNQLELVVSFHNPNGCNMETLNKLLEELKNADLTPDKE